MTAGPPASFRRAERLTIVLGHALVVILLVCVAQAVVGLLGRLLPGWEGGLYPWLAGLVTVEALLSERVVRAIRTRQVSGPAYRAAELALLLAGLRVLLLARLGLPAMLAQVAQWPADPNLILAGEFVPAALGLLMVWGLASWFGESLLDLEGDERLFGRLRDELVADDRAQARRRLRSLVFGGGLVMVAAAALARSDLRALGLLAGPSAGVGLGALVVYFASGLLLLSLGQFAVLRARWGLAQVPVRPQLAGWWAAATVALLAGVGVLVSFLPTGYTLDLLDLAGFALSGLVTLIYGMLFILLAPAAYAVTWLLRALGRPTDDALPPPALPPLPQAPSAPLTVAEWEGVGRSVVFWAVLLGLLILAGLVYLRGRPLGALTAGRWGRAWSWLAARWQSARGGWRQAQRAVSEWWQMAGWRAVRPAAGLAAVWRYVNVRALTPRDQVRFFYRALLRRARESGAPRHPAQTPAEYAPILRAAWPEQAGSVNELTDAFQAAQYSGRPIPPAVAHAARAAWAALRPALRRRADPAPGQTSETMEAK